MVDEQYYEETPDHNLEKMVAPGLRVKKVKAFPLTRPRVIGDISLRSFLQLYKKAKQLIRDEKIDFLFIPIPSFYAALLGRMLHSSTGIRYGIDYIDPWVHSFPGSNKLFSRHWFSTKLAKMLEPVAVKKASLVTGVAEGYYKGVLERNPHLQTQSLFGAMPYGGEASDHTKVKQLGLEPYLFQQKPDKLQLVYAGAMLPRAYEPLERVIRTIAADPGSFESLEIHFIGTGKTPNDSQGFNIRPLAEKYGLWEKTIFEYPRRIPYLDVLVHLDNADGVFILGSTEPHYTPSKVYQGVLSAKPIMALLHKDSTAVSVLRQSKAGIVLPFDGEAGLDAINNGFTIFFKQYQAMVANFDPAHIDRQVFEQYSAREVTRQLAGLLDQIVGKSDHSSITVNALVHAHV